MLSAFLITLREGLEASLIIAIILAYLARTGNRQWFKRIRVGTLLAIATSVAVGAGIFFTVGKLTGRAEQVFEGIAMFTATVILTWMIFWMRKQAKDIKANLQNQIDIAIGKSSTRGLVTLAFIAVTREGIETALFLFASSRVAESPTLSIAGGALGLAIAVAIGYSLYKGTVRLNLRAFFNVTSLLLILFAAGLLAHGIHEFHEAAIIPPVIENVWNVNHLLPENSTIGRTLTAIFGYNANPSLVEAVAYFGYLGSALLFYFNRNPFFVGGSRPRSDGWKIHRINSPYHWPS